MSRLFPQLVVLAACGFAFWGLFIEGPGSDGAPDTRQGQDAPERPTRERNARRDPTPAEQRAKRDLEALLRAELQMDRLVRTNGRVLQGRVLSESPSSVRFAQGFGSTGQMELSIPRSEIREVVRNAAAPPPVSFRDVRFQLELPQLKFYRRPPFTIVSDQDFFRVADAVAELEDLKRSGHAPVRRALHAARARRRHPAALLLALAGLRALPQAPRAEISYASGFYSWDKDRLVVFDQSSSKWARDATREIDRMKASHRQAAARHGDLSGLQAWHSSATGTIHAEARRANRSILRHEGAHQLLFNYGVHSEHRAEHPWLVEGLASFCEDGFGSSGQRVEDARQRKLRAGFAELVDFRSLAEFGALQRNGRSAAPDPARTSSATPMRSPGSWCTT